MQIRYFAWLKDHTGCSHETLALPQEVSTIAQLIAHLEGRGAGYQRAFQNREVVRAAINQEFATLDDVIDDRDEIGFFPPVTGG